MTPYIVTRCLRRGAPHRMYPYSIGHIELRNAAADMESERKALQQSMASHGESAVQPDFVAARASTIVEAASAQDAFLLAEPRINEALDVLTAINPTRAFSSYGLMEAGCARDLTNGTVTPRMPAAGIFNPWSTVLMEQ